MNFRQRLEQGRKQQQAAHTPVIDDDDDQAARYYGMGRGYTPVCLELRLPDGSRQAFPYSNFTEMNFDADNGIELQTIKKRITITGRGLLPLFDRLLTYRVRYVQADVGNDMQEDGLFVADILIELRHDEL